MAIAVEQTVTGSTTTGNTTLTSWTPGSNELVLLFIAQRNETIAPSVSGNGLTWVEVANVDNVQGQNGVSVWRAMGASPSAGSITVTLTGNTGPAFAVASCFSGVDTGGTNGSGAVEATGTATGPATDDNDMMLSVTTLTDNAWAVAVGTYRNNTFTVPGDQTGISTGNLVGTGGDTTTCSVWYKAVATAGSATLGGTDSLSGVADWCCIAVSIKPAVTAITGSLSKTMGAVTALITVALDSFGVASITLAGVTVASVGTLGINGVGAATLAAVTASGTGAVATAGTAAITLGALTLTAPGTVAIAGTLSKTQGALTAVSTGALDIAGTLGVTLGGLTLTSDGQLATGNQGSASVTLGALVLAATGAVDITGALDGALDGATVSGAGALDVVGALDTILGALVIVATGEGPGVGGNVAVLLAPLEIEAEGALEIATSAGLTLGAVAVAATGAIANTGEAAITLGAVVVVATGTLSDGPNAELSVTLGAITLVATGADLTVLAVVYGIVYGASRRAVVYGAKQRGSI